MTDAGASWTDDRVELLKRLWAEGLSASQIAAQIGGVSRNAVIGKVHRLGLSGRGKAPAPTAQPRQKLKPTRPAAAPLEAEAHPDREEIDAMPQTMPQQTADPAGDETATDIALPASERVTIMELREFMCRWPIGDPTTAEFRFCGARAITALPYCPHHAQIAYQPAADRRRGDRRIAIRA